MAEVGLFAEPVRTVPAPRPDTTPGEQLRARQAANIRQGFHPLGDLPGGPYRLGRIRLHPDASRAGAREEVPPDALTCGGCRFRQLVHGGARHYPKCTLGRREIPSPAGDPPGSHAGVRTIPGPRETHGDRSDVRAWWPACMSYEPLEEST